WPVIEGYADRPGMKPPVLMSGNSSTWAPAGLEYMGGSLYWGGLRGESLYEAEISGGKIRNLTVHYRKDFGRIRAVEEGPEGDLYITTSNTDGRGVIRQGDDKIILIRKEALD
ncbi:MAG: PQQ-dependent sugar dehydrogenase, partial [Candidatus Nanohaloarchaea archaeon]